MMFFAVGCEKFDDRLIWEKLDEYGEAIRDHEQRLSALELLCRQMNTNISSLQTIVDALQDKDYVTNISPITEDGKVIGYTITFSKSGAITIYHGQDGKDVVIPKLKIENGYWYVSYDNGTTWVEIGKATGEDGADGDSMFKVVTYDGEYIYNPCRRYTINYSLSYRW